MSAASHNITSSRPVLSVFYDGDCPLCSREIAHYRRQPGADRIAWIDITHNEEMLLANDLSYAAAMDRFHVRDAGGQWHTGAYAFARLWSILPAYRWLAALLRGSRLLPVVDRVYSAFARWRMRRRCTDGTCGLD